MGNTFKRSLRKYKVYFKEINNNLGNYSLMIKDMGLRGKVILNIS